MPNEGPENYPPKIFLYFQASAWRFNNKPKISKKIERNYTAYLTIAFKDRLTKSSLLSRH